MTQKLEKSFTFWMHENHPTIPESSLAIVLELAEQGATVPFMARYRKERTGNLDEVKIQTILDAKEKWDQLLDRQKFILEKISEQKKLTDELKNQILSTFDMPLLEDLYLPYKQKKKTKATLAKEAGIQPFADWIWNCGHGLEQPQPGQTLELWAFTFRNEAQGFSDVPAVIQGAQDILVERLSELQHLRQRVRTAFFEKGMILTAKGKKPQELSKFENYFSYREQVQKLLLPENSHRYLAIRRGWTEEELSLSLQGPPTSADSVEDTEFQALLLQAFENEAYSVADSPGTPVLKKAAYLAYKVYVFPSIENEVHKALREVADGAAIHVFSENLKKLLLASPLGAKAVLGVDPGIRTGCKLAVIDHTGKYIASTVMHLNSEEGKNRAKEMLPEILKTGQISTIAVGNGTAGRETEVFFRTLLKEAKIAIPVVLVSESGASVYSASEAAREEFPELDLTIRGAISIARRLQDPLAEMVKVDPKSIGVGQYQHDVSQPALKRSLEHTVEFCVNQIGVNVNTASYHLLAYVSGIGPSLAKSLVEHRQQQGLFQTREDLLKVPRFSQKVFEQAAGFLRIPNSQHPLDNTAVHPEKYPVLEAFCQKHQKQLTDLLGTGVELLKKDPWFQATLGAYTFADLIQELEKPGRDPRNPFQVLQFREDIFDLKDLKEGMICPGIVTNVTNFGAFVDIGVHQDGLVHLSQIRDEFVKDPKLIIFPGDNVRVKVLAVHLEKKQISLSIREAQNPTTEKRASHSENTSKKQPTTRKPMHFAKHSSALPSSEQPISPSKRQNLRPQKPIFNNPFESLGALKGQLKKN